MGKIDPHFLSYLWSTPSCPQMRIAIRQYKARYNKDFSPWITGISKLCYEYLNSKDSTLFKISRGHFSSLLQLISLESSHILVQFSIMWEKNSDSLPWGPIWSAPHSSLDISVIKTFPHSRHSDDFSLLVMTPSDQLIPVSVTLHAVYLARKILAPHLGINGSFSSFSPLLRNILWKSSLSTITYHFSSLC